MLKLNFSLAHFRVVYLFIYFWCVSLKKLKKITFNWNFTCMLLLFFVLLFFLTSPTRKKKYLKCQNNSSNTSEFPHNKIYFQFFGCFVFTFLALFVLSHSPKKKFFVCCFRQPAIEAHQAALKINWRQFKVRMKSLSCNYNNDKKKKAEKDISRHNLYRRQLNFVFKHFTRQN